MSAHSPTHSLTHSLTHRQARGGGVQRWGRCGVGVGAAGGSGLVTPLGTSKGHLGTNGRNHYEHHSDAGSVCVSFPRVEWWCVIHNALCVVCVYVCVSVCFQS